VNEIEDLKIDLKSMNTIRGYYQRNVMKLARDLEIFKPGKDDIKYNQFLKVNENLESIEEQER